jgi:Helix-turn-helix domain
VKRSEAERLIGRSDLTTADRIVFLRLCNRADNLTAEIPAKFTPSLAKLAAETSLHVSTVARSLAHLEQHRWIQRERTKGGRRRRDGTNHRTRYLLIACGTPLPCDCPRKPPGRPRKQAQDEPVPEPSEQSHGARVYEPKQSHGASRNSRFYYADAAGQPTDCTEGRRSRGEGRGEAGSCPVCQEPLDPALSEYGYLTHPCCNPAEEGPLIRMPDEAAAIMLVRSRLGGEVIATGSSHEAAA